MRTRSRTKTFFTATYTGRGEFYTGIRQGERVLIEWAITQYLYDGEPKTAQSFSAQSLADPGAWLSVQLDDLADVRDVAEAA